MFLLQIRQVHSHFPVQMPDLIEGQFVNTQAKRDRLYAPITSISTLQTSRG
jgi:hypothetical protein